MTGATHGLSHSAFFFSFSREGLYGSVFVEQGSSWDRTPPCWHAAWFLTPLPSPLLFLEKIKSGPTLGIQADPTHDPQTCTTCHTLHYFPRWDRGEGNSFIIPLFLWSVSCPPSFFFILDLLPFPETLHRNTCRGLNSVHCFQSSLPHLDSCGVGPVVVRTSATWILLLCYHSTSATET